MVKLNKLQQVALKKKWLQAQQWDEDCTKAPKGVSFLKFRRTVEKLPLLAWPFISEADQFDIEEAVFWFATHNHSGQSSNLYEALVPVGAPPPGHVTDALR